MTDTPIVVQLVDSAGNRLCEPSVRLDIRFFVQGRLRYTFDLGSTDADGTCRSSLEDLQEQLGANRKLFLMDYNIPLEECDATVGIVAPTEGELADRRTARERWFAAGEPDAAKQPVKCDEQKFELKCGVDNQFKLTATQTPR